MNNTTYNTKDVEKIIDKLETKLSITQIIQLITKLCSKNEYGEQQLLNLLIHRRIFKQKKIAIVDSLIFEKLSETKYINIKTKFTQYFGQGIIKLENNLKIDYQPLQDLLITKQFQEADKLTQQYLCELAGLNKLNTRTWLYFTDISTIPSEDLLYIDILWKTYSQEKFGFSIQRNIWLNNNSNWTIFWQKIGWTIQDIPCRYPNEFIWDTNAPKGHLPLFNQLRGIQVLSALFEHNAWQAIND
uniref:GUN4-like domain-containing protein n=1 Tax=Antithamnionella ternifolia TaxID=207919 RepID=A0A4D6WJX6_9FLOR|nr:hypothetical protein [Antithamnionella ternifolia]